MTLDSLGEKSLLPKKSALKRKNETIQNEELPLKKGKVKDIKKSKKKVNFLLNGEAKKNQLEPKKLTLARKILKKKKVDSKVKNVAGKNIGKFDKEKGPLLALAKKKKKPGIENRTKKTFSKKPELTSTKNVPKNQRLTRKEHRVIRKQTKNNYELATKAKQLWEIVRCNTTRKGKTDQLCEELHKLIKGNANKLIYAHDTSRVIQCLVALGNETIRNDLFKELKMEIIKMSKSKYAKFFVNKFLKYGSPEQRNFIISSFYRDVVNLMKHNEAASVVECAYNEFAKADQRAKLTEEFYGPSFRVFKNEESSSLSEILAKDPSKKESILSYMKETLIPMTQKSTVAHSLIHHVLNEYFRHCEQPDKEEMIEALRESVPFILHSKDGSRVAMQCLWHGTAKIRKHIIKNFKTHVTKICKEEHGHWVLLAAFDCVDDTTLLSKVVLAEIIKDLEEIILDTHGRKVIMHLISPRDPVQGTVEILRQGDDNPHSKKDKSTRSQELLAKISEPLVKFLAANAKKMVFTPSSNVTARLIIKHAIGDFSLVYQEIAKLVSEPFVPGYTKAPHIIDHTAGHLILKALLDLDKKKDDKQELFCSHLKTAVPENSYKSWIQSNRGAFLLVRILETEQKEIAEHYKNVLLPLKGQLKKKTFSGANILLKKLHD